MKPLSQIRTTYLKPERLEFSALAALHQKLLAPKLMFTPEKLELCCMGLRLIDASYIKPKTIGTQTQTSKRNAVGTQVDFSLPTTSTTSCDTSKSFFEECDDDCENIESSQASSSCRSMSGDTKSVLDEPKHLVFKSCLASLLKHCSCCGSVVTKSEESTRGSMLSIKLFCINGHESVWSSQPLFNNISAGNLLTSASILFSGNTFSKISQLASLLN